MEGTKGYWCISGWACSPTKGCSISFSPIHDSVLELKTSSLRCLPVKNWDFSGDGMILKRISRYLRRKTELRYPHRPHSLWDGYQVGCNVEENCSYCMKNMQNSMCSNFYKIFTLLTELRKNILLFLDFNYCVNRCNMYRVTFTTNAMGRHCMLEELQPGDIWWLTPHSPRPGMSLHWRGWLGGLQTLFTFPPWSWSTEHQVLFLTQWALRYSETTFSKKKKKKWLPGTKIISWVVPGISNTQLRRNSLEGRVVSAIRLTAQFIGTMQPLKHRIVIF